MVQPRFKEQPRRKRKWRRPINAVSDKRRATNVIRREAVVAEFGQHPECGACAPLALVGISRFTTGCRGFAQDAHETTSRARAGLEANLTDTDGIVPVSRACHSFITTHPDEAEAAGLALPSKPVRQPLRMADPRTGIVS